GQMVSLAGRASDTRERFREFENGDEAGPSAPPQQIHAGATETDRGSQRLMSTRAAAENLGVSRAIVERLVYRGELPVVKMGIATRYDVDDLNRYIENNRAGRDLTRPYRDGTCDFVREGEGIA